ncbi:MAG TPA: 3'-5' exonuclease [Cytophagales bacterium]|nr:3'-5' exonuclease [Cytophagales bacterium]
MNPLLKNLVFIDIETVSLTHDFHSLPPRLQEAWAKKSFQLDTEKKDFAAHYFEKAAIYAEFGKVLVIGIGFFHENEQKELCLRVKALSNPDEKTLLVEFCQLMEKGFPPTDVALCAHNGKEFDFPYLCRRMLVNGISLPNYLNISGKKPWEIRHHDTLEMWKFGDRKNYTSLDLLATIFNIPSSKNGIDGSMVNHAYYNDKKLDSIVEYCKRDVQVLAQLFLKMHNIPLPKEENMYTL